MKIVVIGDQHAIPDTNLDRFTWLGKMIHDVKPTWIVNMGDVFDFASLCFHSKPKELENARYQKDVNAGLEAQDRIWIEIKKFKKKLPNSVLCLGNHDIRPDRYVEENPVFEGKISTKDCQFDKYWDEVVPFLEPFDIAGVDFLHYAISGLMGRPIGGTHPAWTIIKKRNKSTVVGHSHVVDYKIDKTPGRSLMGLATGCYTEDELDYAGQANDMWSRGISILDNVEDGLFDFSWVSLDRIKREYA